MPQREYQDLRKFTNKIYRQIERTPTGNERCILNSVAKVFEYLWMKLKVLTPGVEILGAAIMMACNIVNLKLPDDELSLENTYIDFQESLLEEIYELKDVFPSISKERNPFSKMESVDFESDEARYCYDSPIMPNENVRTSIDDINDIFSEFLNGSYNSNRNSFDKIMYQHGWNESDNLENNELGTYLISLKETCSRRLVSDVFGYFIIVKAKYLYIHTAYRIFTRETEKLLDAFDRFIEDFIELQCILRILLNSKFDIQRRGRYHFCNYLKYTQLNFTISLST